MQLPDVNLDATANLATCAVVRQLPTIIEAQATEIAALRAKNQQQQVWDALAVAVYHAQTGVPVLRLLLSDDEAVYDHLTAMHAHHWIHDWRHYAELRPAVAGRGACQGHLPDSGGHRRKARRSFFHYLRDQLVSPGTTPALAKRIAERDGLTAQPAG